MGIESISIKFYLYCSCQKKIQVIVIVKAQNGNYFTVTLHYFLRKKEDL